MKGWLSFIIVALVVGLLWLASPRSVLAEQLTNQQVSSQTSPVWDDNPAKHADKLEESARKGSITGPESYAQLWISSNISALAVQLLGYPTTDGHLQGGAMQFLAGGIDALVRARPASSVDYLAYMGSKLHFPGTPTVAYAAPGDNPGIGFSQLTAVVKIWTVFRNIAYLFFAVIFVVSGLMIMFRVKIDPKTAASIQSALPKIVLALILVTFSYAIAGFLIDIMYVSLALIITVMSGLASGTDAEGNKLALEQLLSGSIFRFILGGWLATTDSVSRAVYSVVEGVFSQILTGVGGTILGVISYGFAFLIVGIAIIWALFKTWLTLISAYANIVLGIIFSPLQLMLDAIPGQNQFGGWLRTMLANLLAFPVVVVMLAVGQAIVTNLGQPVTPATELDPRTGFVPPLIGVGSLQTMLAFVGLGILLTIPKTLEMLKEVLKAPAFKYGTAWQENLNVGLGSAGALGRGAYGRAVSGGQARFDTYAEAERKAAIVPGSPAPNPISRWDRFVGSLPRAGRR